MNSPIRIATLDIETTPSLNATWARLLCACFKFGDEEEVYTIDCHRGQDESRALKQVRDTWPEIDVLLTWNGKLFDIPFLNGRLTHHHQKTLEAKMHVDLRWMSAKLGSQGNSLHAASKFVGLDQEKVHLDPDTWLLATDTSNPESKDAYTSIVEHCKQDVRMTEDMARHYAKAGLIVRITK